MADWNPYLKSCLFTPFSEIQTGSLKEALQMVMPIIYRMFGNGEIPAVKEWLAEVEYRHGN